jgi:hypothetical protein
MNADCYYESNPLSGGVGSHSSRCARELATPHSVPTHHVRLGGFCGLMCGPCVAEFGKRKDFKEAIVREITEAPKPEILKHCETCTCGGVAQ